MSENYITIFKYPKDLIKNETIGAWGQARTGDLFLFREALLPTELPRHIIPAYTTKNINFYNSNFLVELVMLY